MEITLIGVASIVSMLIGWGFKIWREMKKDELSTRQKYQLERVADMAVRASEEIAKKGHNNGTGKWSNEDKYQFAAEAIMVGAEAISPALAKSLSPEMLKFMIHSAIQAIGLGATGKAKANEPHDS